VVAKDVGIPVDGFQTLVFSQNTTDIIKWRKGADKNHAGQRSIKEKLKAPKKAKPAARNISEASTGRLIKQTVNASYQLSGQHNNI